MKPATGDRSTERKLSHFFELCRLAEDLALAGLRRDHPELALSALRRKLAERLSLYRRDKWAAHG